MPRTETVRADAARLWRSLSRSASSQTRGVRIPWRPVWAGNLASVPVTRRRRRHFNGDAHHSNGRPRRSSDKDHALAGRHAICAVRPDGSVIGAEGGSTHPSFLPA
jgi:hypothetical protein